MKYSYYPGCSLERNASAYQQSITAVAKPLDMEFIEVEDWNCCGATEYSSIDALPAAALIGRNLAIAAQQNSQVVAPCSACFLNLKKIDHYMSAAPEWAEKINIALAAGGLHYEPGSVKARHLLDVVINDVGYDAVAEHVTRPLYNLRVANYYGCMIARPGGLESFDDAEFPTSMDKLVEVLGAKSVNFPMKTHCCGGHMTQISENTALSMIHSVLKNAVDNQADIIVTTCPMCHLNLDGYQGSVNRNFGTNYNIPILYYTQLMGLAFGIPEAELGIGKELVDARPALAKISIEPPPKPKKKRPSKKALPMPTLREEV